MKNNLNETKIENNSNFQEENKHKAKSPKSIKTFSTSETILLVIIALIIGLSIGGLLFSTSKGIETASVSDAHLKEFIKNYDYIVNNYYKDIDKSKLINSAIAGMMNSLDDPYSMYFDEEETNNFSISLNGSYKGIGIQITKDEETGYMIIVSVFKNSPASTSGLKAGDKIISINDKKSVDMTVSEMGSYIRNNSTNDLEMSILRNNETLNVNVSKSTVTLSSVVSKTYDINNKKVGYIYIGIFASNTAEQFKSELDNLEKQNIDYLIIDVRGNTGGHLTAVDDILDIFLNSKQIMYQFSQNDKITTIYGTGKENKKYDIILLGDEVSASASEVLIAGIKENLNSVFIGKKTYGKGTVQELVTLSDGTQYKITVKKWLTPSGKWINDTKGIEPDIDVELSDEYYNTLEDKDDTQLQKALEYIGNK